MLIRRQAAASGEQRAPVAETKAKSRSAPPTAEPQPVEVKGACCGEKSQCSSAVKPQAAEVKSACGGKGEQSHCSSASGKCKSGC